MLKRISALFLALLLCLSLAACVGTGTPKLSTLTLETKENSEGKVEPVHNMPNDAKYDDTLFGLMAFMEDAKVVTRSVDSGTVEQAIASGDTALIQMAYKEINALDGYRYQFLFSSSTVMVEFYEFDPADPKASEVIQSVANNGSFHLLDKDIEAVMHPNGKYMMIYIDSNVEKREVNAAQKAWAEEVFRAFKHTA